VCDFASGNMSGRMITKGMPESDTEFTPERLKQALTLPGRSQSALAEKLNLDPSAVNRIVNGRRNIKAQELRLIIEYLAETSANAHEERPVVKAESEDANNILEALRKHMGGRNFASSFGALTLSVYSNIETRLRPVLKFPTAEQSDAFWSTGGNNLNVLYYLAKGADIISGDIAEDVLNLSKLVRAVLDTTHDRIEDDPEVLRTLQVYLGPAYYGVEDWEQLRNYFAMQTSALALAVLKGRDKAIEAVRGVKQALERNILGDSQE